MRSHLIVTPDLHAALGARGVVLPAGGYNVTSGSWIETPAALHGGFNTDFDMQIGAFSYSWSPLRDVACVGRYCSFAGGIHFGEMEHPTDWISTSSFTYDTQGMFGAFTAARGTGFRPCTLPPGSRRDPITIGNDVWIGARAYLRGGVSIGDGAIVGTQAVVTKDVAPYAVVAGNPARVVRHRFPPRIVERLLAGRWWRFAFPDFAGLDITDLERFLDGLEAAEQSGRIREFHPPRLNLMHFAVAEREAAAYALPAAPG